LANNLSIFEVSNQSLSLEEGIAILVNNYTGLDNSLIATYCGVADARRGLQPTELMQNNTDHSGSNYSPLQTQAMTEGLASCLVRRRGRPKKKRGVSPLSYNKLPGKPAEIIRKAHNESVARSRDRLNQYLEEQWKEIPDEEKLRQFGSLDDVCRATMVKAATDYMRKLKEASGEKGCSYIDDGSMNGV
jgi:hypothetical protein